MGTETTVASPLASLRGLMARPLTSYYLLLSSSGLLLVIGLVMVFSATSVESYADSGNPYASITKQSLYALVGLVAFWLAHRTPLRDLQAVLRPAGDRRVRPAGDPRRRFRAAEGALPGRP